MGGGGLWRGGGGRGGWRFRNSEVCGWEKFWSGFGLGSLFVLRYLG